MGPADPSGFTKAFFRQEAYLRRFFHRYARAAVLREYEIEDLEHMTYLGLWRRAAGLAWKDPEVLRHGMRRVAWNILRSTERRLARRRTSPEPAAAGADGEPRVGSDATAPGGSSSAVEVVKRFRLALELSGLLSSGDYPVLKALLLEGRRQCEVAADLGVSRAAVTQRRAREMERFRSALKSLFSPDDYQELSDAAADGTLWKLLCPLRAPPCADQPPEENQSRRPPPRRNLTPRRSSPLLEASPTRLP